MITQVWSLESAIRDCTKEAFAKLYLPQRLSKADAHGASLKLIGYATLCVSFACVMDLPLCCE